MTKIADRTTNEQEIREQMAKELIDGANSILTEGPIKDTIIQLLKDLIDKFCMRK